MSDKKEKNEYLENDNDILEELNHSYSVDATHLFRKLQIQSILRNRKSLEDSSESTRKFSIALFVVAFVQVFIALFQFLFSVFTSNQKIFGFIMIVLLLSLVYFMIKEFKGLF